MRKRDTATFGRTVLLVGALLFTTVQCQLIAQIGDGPQGNATPAPVSQITSRPTPTVTAATVATETPTATATPEPSPTASPSATPTVTATPPATETPLPHPLFCSDPPEDYARIDVGPHTLNARTMAMLQTAQKIYEGPGNIMRITQGSYRDVVEASFGTHAGGGAVDISIRNPQNESVLLWEEAGPMVTALRYAGFAAWFRDAGDLGENSPAHIHAIAVGDAELSAAAQAQVTGEGGYFAGMDGLIAPYGPHVDPHGGPVICPWMGQ
jgi:hypothetical protein